MRLLSSALAALSLIACSQLFAELAITPDETKSQAEFNKAYRVPDKDARKAALGILSASKHSSSFRLIYAVAANPRRGKPISAWPRSSNWRNPSARLQRRQTAGKRLFRFEKHRQRQRREAVISYGKALAPVQFKSEIVFAFISRLTALRYPKIPPLIQQNGPAAPRTIAV